MECGGKRSATPLFFLRLGRPSPTIRGLAALRYLAVCIASYRLPEFRLSKSNAICHGHPVSDLPQILTTACNASFNQYQSIAFTLLKSGIDQGLPWKPAALE
jgi:hypothetical protein